MLSDKSSEQGDQVLYRVKISGFSRNVNQATKLINEKTSIARNLDVSKLKKTFKLPRNIVLNYGD